ncbi:MAG TPA: aspartate kinase [bacterium]|uniref:Aspartokinase n=1 Tax=candidate division TA06 bacterium ADurb.Bin417 TaxID=1852828 RepID=A0A1V5MD28_UNCT6|nr:MAG: Aspartokinase [candidate division TA06 bacterium ADurb.Bin417]HNS48454.1 aspartate kinase [bacterium]
MNPVVVQKYGGSSVATTEKIARIAEKIKRRVDQGARLAVVVSAMGDTTDYLLELAEQIGSQERGPELDLLLSTGEIVSASLMAMALNRIGVPARAFTGREAGIITDTTHTKARIRRLQTGRIKAVLREGSVAVITGFQGVAAGDRVTTLGRGGSDLSAVALAKGLKAGCCEIYTDVPGIFTADPRVEPESRLIPRLSYEEALEMAAAGAAVMQARAVEFGQKYRVPILVKSTFEEGNGTMITRVNHRRRSGSNLEEPLVSAVTGSGQEAKVSIFGVPDRPGLAARIFSSVAAANINVDMIIQNVSKDGRTDLSFTIPADELKRAREIASQVAAEIGAAGTAFDSDIGKVAIIGIGMQSHPGVAARMFSALGREGINIEMISTSEIKISCVVRKSDLVRAVRVLHAEFGLSRKPA